MDKEQALNVVRAYKAAIRPIVGDAKVVMFGSYAKGCARPDSDIDVAVIVPELEGDWLKTSSCKELQWISVWRYCRQVHRLIADTCIDTSQTTPHNPRKWVAGLIGFRI